MKFQLALIITALLSFASCQNENQPVPDNVDVPEVTTEPEFQNKAHELVHGMTQKVGNFGKLVSLHDVTYTYTYITTDGKTNSSTEKYIFDGEYSYGKYETHERTFPQLEGLIEQGYDGNEYWLKHNGEFLTDESLLESVAFIRPTNFYWFTMMQKLADPGLNYEHLGETTIEAQDYDIVKVTFNSKDDKPTDIYQVYINKKTSLVDQFLFTVADYGKMETPYLMKLEYEEVQGILLPTTRLYKQSTWNADVTDKPWTKATWTDIKFNTGLTTEDFAKGSM